MDVKSMRMFAVALAALLMTACAGTAPSLAPYAAVEKTEIQHWTTANGTRVYFVPAPELPMLDVRLVFDAGSARDGAKGGVAKMTAALLDQGAGALDADAIAAQMEGLGARLGGSAARDMAWFTLRSLNDPQRLQPALDLFATILAAPTFAQADFQRERQRLLVGLQQQEQQPRSVAEKAFYYGLYGDHPYAQPEAGTPATVQALTRADLQAFYDRYYVARNAVLALVGDVDRATAERIAEQLTQGLAPGAPAAVLPAVAPLSAAQNERIAHPSSQSHVRVGVPGMTRTDPDYFVLYVGNHVLGGGGLVSRISDEIREKRGLSYSAYSYFAPMARRGPFTMGLQTRNEQVDEAVRVLRETLLRFRAEGPSEQELQASKKNITGGYALRVDSNAKIVEYLAMIGFYALPLDYLDTFNAKVEAVTREQVRDAFQRRVDPERMVTVVVGGS